MHWEFQGDGTWQAQSSHCDEFDNFTWEIVVCDDGTFDVSESDSELINGKVTTFDTLELAKAYCQSEEKALQKVHQNGTDET
jgi:hypothetical protein